MSAFSPIPSTSGSERFNVIIVEDENSMTYIGKASPGVKTSDAGWNIQRITTIFNTQKIEWATGRPFSSVWDDYKTLTYS